VSLHGQLEEETRESVRRLHHTRMSGTHRAGSIYESLSAIIACAGLDDSSAVVDVNGRATAVFGEIVEPGLTVNMDPAMGPRLIARTAAERGPSALEGLNGH